MEPHAWDALRDACQRGCIDTARRLTTEFKLTANLDQRLSHDPDYLGYLLRRTCLAGQIETAKFVVETFDIEWKEYQSDDLHVTWGYVALISSCRSESEEMKEWVMGYFAFDEEDLKKAMLDADLDWWDKYRVVTIDDMYF